MQTVGGYRLVRKLGEGERADIYLGHSDDHSWSGDDPPMQESGSGVAVIKVYRAATTTQSIDREIDALGRVQSRHILAIRDVATAGDGRPCLILPRLGSSNLGHLLAIRSSIGAGEAATLLVPLIEVMGLLHSAGVTHGALRLEAVLFDHAGAPVLSRFGKAELIASGSQITPAQLDEDPNVIDDRGSLGCVVASVLARIDDSERSASLDEARHWLAAAQTGKRYSDDGATAPQRASSMFTSADFERLSELIFDFAVPRAILFSDVVSESPIRSAAWGDYRRIAPADGAWPLGPHSQPDPPLEQDVPRHQIFTAAPLPEWLETLIARVSNRNLLPWLRTRLTQLLAPVRRSVWIVGGAGLTAIVVAFAASPSRDFSHSQNETPKHTVIAEYPAPDARPPVDSTALPGPADARLAAVAGDDPLAAGIALISLRHECLTRHSIPCLANIDQAGSALLEADTHLIGRLSSGASLSRESSFDGFTVNLIQQLGDTAILSLLSPASGASTASESEQTNPVPLLVVRSETGWRIRDADFS